MDRTWGTDSRLQGVGGGTSSREVGGGGTWQRSQKMRGGRGKRHEGGTNLEALDTAAQTQANLFLLSCLGDFHTEELLLGAVTVVPVKLKKGSRVRENVGRR